MDALQNRLPSPDALQKRAPKIAGFAFGAALVLIGGLFIGTVYSGTGLSDGPNTGAGEVVYPRL